MGMSADEPLIEDIPFTEGCEPKVRTPQVVIDGCPCKSAPRKSSTTGFRSDVRDGKSSRSSGLVRQGSMGAFHAKYDTSHSTNLGKGTYGTVTTVRHRESDSSFAMKIVEAGSGSDLSMAALRNELELHRRLDHPNICKVIEAFEDTANHRFYIIMELCTGGMLISRMNDHQFGFEEAKAAEIVAKMLSAVLYCHQHGIVHRDIKLDNFLYDSMEEDAELKLIDFGFAAAVLPGNELMRGQLGTPSYMAPELWSRERESAYDSSVDMWALGASTYMLLSGMKPFHSEDKETKRRMIQESPLSFPSNRWARKSKAAMEFCSALMAKQPRHRLSASEAIKHPFIMERSRPHSASPNAVNTLLDNTLVVEALEEYGSNAAGLKRLALEVIAFLTPPKDLVELRRAFQAIDTDSSGTIDIREWQDAMGPASKLPHDKLELIFHVIDSNDSGEIDYNEFLAATLSSRGVERRSLKAAFSILDHNADGFICRSDLIRALDGLLSPTALDAVLQGADCNECVSYNAFKRSVIGDWSERDFSDMRGG